MQISAASHANRKLVRMNRYTPASLLEPDVMAYFSNIPTQGDEVLGCYWNDLHDATQCLVIYTNGLVFKPCTSSMYVRYEDIDKIPVDDYQDPDRDDFHLHLLDGTVISITISGRDPEHGTHDKYNVMMFIESVSAKREV